MFTAAHEWRGALALTPALPVPEGEPGPSSSHQQPQQRHHSQHMHNQSHVHQQPQPPHQHQAQLHVHQAAAAAAAAAAAEAHQQQQVAMPWVHQQHLGGLAQFTPFPYSYGGYPAFWPTPYAIPYEPRGPGRGMAPRAFLYHPAPMQFMGHQRPPPGTPGVSSGVQVRGSSLKLLSQGRRQHPLLGPPVVFGSIQVRGEESKTPGVFSMKGNTSM